MRAPQRIYRPAGALLAPTIAAAAALLAVSRPTHYRMSAACPGGRRLTRLNPTIGGTPRSRWLLPDGRAVVGAAAAGRALGITRQQVYERADWDADAWAWRVRPRKETR